MNYSYGVAQYALYEDGKEFLGLANIELPEISNKSIDVSGAGIPGDVNLPVPGHVEAMTAKINFFDISKSAYTLLEQRVHKVHLWVAHAGYNSEQHEMEIGQYKHILYLIPKKFVSGTVAPASAQGVSGEYSCTVRKDFVDGECVLHIDPLNNIYIDKTGNNLLDKIQKAIGH